MKLNFKGFFKAAGLFPLALMLSGCISYALVSHTAKGSSGEPAEFGKNRTLRFSGHP